MKRCSGVLLPIFSLPSPYGIGTLGKAAYDWIDFLHEAGQQLWQVLPIGPTSFGDSPYQSFSAFAGNPYFIDLEQLCEDGLLQKEDCAPLADQADSTTIDYAKQYQYRYVILKKAYSRFDNPNEITRFRKAHNWADDYALFMALKDSYNGLAWTQWPSAILRCGVPAGAAGCSTAVLTGGRIAPRSITHAVAGIIIIRCTTVTARTGAPVLTGRILLPASITVTMAAGIDRLTLGLPASTAIITVSVAGASRRLLALKHPCMAAAVRASA